MDNRQRLINKVAEFTGIPATKVKAVISTNHLLLRETLETRQKKTFYLRKVGFFTWWEIVFNNTKQKINTKKIQNEDSN